MKSPKMDGLGYPLHSGHPSNQTAADSLVCLTGLTIAEWNNLKRDTKLGLPYKVDKSGE